MKRHPVATLLLGLVTVLVFVLLYGPIFIPIVSSFFTVKYGAVDWSQVNLDAYRKLTENESVLEAVTNTFIVGLSAVALSLLIFFREVELPRSMATIIIGHTVFVLALVYRTILVRLQGIGLSMIEASYDLGANAPQTFL